MSIVIATPTTVAGSSRGEVGCLSTREGCRASLPDTSNNLNTEHYTGSELVREMAADTPTSKTPRDAFQGRSAQVLPLGWRAGRHLFDRRDDRGFTLSQVARVLERPVMREPGAAGRARWWAAGLEVVVNAVEKVVITAVPSTPEQFSAFSVR